VSSWIEAIERQATQPIDVEKDWEELSLAVGVLGT
jgi:hypothetical protein